MESLNGPVERTTEATIVRMLLPRIALAAFVLMAGGLAQARSEGAESCNSVQVYPFPLNAERPLTAQVRRVCAESTAFLETVEAQVLGDTIRIETTCRVTPLPMVSCQVGQDELGILDAGTYAIDVVDQDSGSLLFSDSVTVGRVTSVPTLRLAGMALTTLVLLGVGLLVLLGQPGRSRFSNNRS